MHVGDSTCFVRAVSELPVRSNEISRYSQLIGGYALHARPGCSWGYEGFTCISTIGRILVGTIVSLKEAAAELPSLCAWRVAGEWYVNKTSAEKHAQATDVELEAVPLPTAPAALVALLSNVRSQALAEARTGSAESAQLRADLDAVRQELASANRLLGRYKRHISSLRELDQDQP